MKKNIKTKPILKIMKHFLLFTALFVFLQITGFAQEKKWTLGECVAYAIENSQSMERQLAQNEIYKQNFVGAIINQAPSISGYSSATSNYGRNIDYTTNTYVNTNSFSNNYQLTASMPVFSGLANLNTTRYHNIMRKMGYERKQELEDDISLRTIAAFYDVLYQQAMVDLAREQLITSDEDLRKVQQMESLGIKGKADLFEMEAQRAGVQYNMVRQQNTLRTLVLKLKEVMFFPIEDALEIDTTIPEILIITEFENDISLDFESTKTNLPAVNVLNLQLMGAKVDYAANKGSLFPSISFNTGLNTGYSSTRLDNNGQKVSFEDQFKNNVGKYLGLSLSIPLFNNNILGTKVRISKQNYHIAQITYNEEIRKLQNVIQQALLDMEGAAEEFMQAQQREKSSDLANTINQRKYEQGLLSVIELHTSENRLLEAKAEKVRAQVTYMIKKRLVDYYNSGVIKIEN